MDILKSILTTQIGKKSIDVVVKLIGKNQVVETNIPINSQQMQVRFRLTSDGFVTEDGWSIDDVNVKVSGQPCHQPIIDLIFENGFD